MAATPARVINKPIAFDRLIVLERPSLARQVAAAAKLNLTAAGVDVVVHCIIESDSGHLNCNIHDYGTTPVDMYGPAIIIADGYRVQTPDQGEFSDGDPTHRIVLTTDMKVHIGPAPAVDLSRGHDPLPFNAFNFTDKASALEAGSFYPERAQRLNRAGVASLDCKILDDLSLACPDPVDEQPPDMGFGPAAQQLALFFRSAPTMKDGQAAVGQWVTVRFTFRPPD